MIVASLCEWRSLNAMLSTPLFSHKQKHYYIFYPRDAVLARPIAMTPCHNFANKQTAHSSLPASLTTTE